MKWARYTEVDQFNLIFAGYHDVRGLEVAENDRRGLAVQITQHITNLLRPTARAGLGNAVRAVHSDNVALFLQDLAERPSIDKVHDQVMALLFHEEIAHAWNAWVIHLQQESCLAPEPLQGLVMVSFILKIIQHLFHRARATQAHVDRAIHRAHPSSSNHAFYFIASVGKFCVRWQAAMRATTLASRITLGGRGTANRGRVL